MTFNKSELQGRVALVTGAARNIGRAIAEQLALGGASVVVNALSSHGDADATVAAIQSKGGRALFHLADVTDPKAVSEMIDRATQEFGPIDILVNNAAVREEWPFEQISLADWRRVVGIVLDGAFICSQAVLPGMITVGSGAIINIGGETGHTGARERAHVVTAKAGLSGFTKALAHDVSSQNITVNCVAPGAMNTEGSQILRHPYSTFKTKRMPLIGRRGEPWEVAAMVRFLCGPNGRYMTGQTLHLNGGHSMP